MEAASILRWQMELRAACSSYQLPTDWLRALTVGDRLATSLPQAQRKLFDSNKAVGETICIVDMCEDGMGMR